LDIPAAERHTCAGKISKCEDTYILGERLDHIDDEEPDVVPVLRTVRGYIVARSPVKKEATPAKVCIVSLAPKYDWWLNYVCAETP